MYTLPRESIVGRGRQKEGYGISRLVPHARYSVIPGNLPFPGRTPESLDSLTSPGPCAALAVPQGRPLVKRDHDVDLCVFRVFIFEVTAGCPSPLKTPVTRKSLKTNQTHSTHYKVHRPGNGQKCTFFQTCCCLLLQYLLQFGSRGRRGVVEDMCSEIRRAKVGVD